MTGRPSSKMKPTPEWAMMLMYVFFGIEAVLCFERASKNKPSYRKTTWYALGIIGIAANTAVYAYSR